MSAAVASLPVVGSSGNDGQDRRLRTGSQWSSQDSASDDDEDVTTAVKKELGNQDDDDDDDDDDDSAFSIDIDDLKRDLGMDVKPLTNDGADPSPSLPPDLEHAPSTASASMPLEHTLRSPSPIEVTVQRLALVKLTPPTQPNPSSKEKALVSEAAKVNEVIRHELLDLLTARPFFIHTFSYR